MVNITGRFLCIWLFTACLLSFCLKFFPLRFAFFSGHLISSHNVPVWIGFVVYFVQFGFVFNLQPFLCDEHARVCVLRCGQKKFHCCFCLYLIFDLIVMLMVCWCCSVLGHTHTHTKNKEFESQRKHTTNEKRKLDVAKNSSVYEK